MSRTIFEVPQSKHPFVGLGTGIIITENGKQEPKVTIRFPLYDIELVTAVGEKAKTVIMEMNSDETFDGDRIEYAKNAACEILSINSYQMNTSTKKQEAVFARWLVFDYAKNSLNFSLSRCGRLFFPEKDHATVLHAINKLKKDELKYLSSWQKEAHSQFWKRMRTYKLSLHENEEIS